jgi:O-antigen biosynthesis protein
MASIEPARPARILILSGVKGDTRRYRTFHLHQQLCMAGADAVLSHLTDPALPSQADHANLIILHRVPYDRYVEKIIGRIQRHGGVVLMDTDDLTFEPEAFQWIDSPDFRDPVRRSLYQAEMDRQRQTLDRCDAVLASTDALADRVRALGKPCWVHRNAANQELVYLSDLARQARRANPGRQVIGYASGTPTHNRDFGSIAPVLQETLAACPQTELCLIGPLEIGEGWSTFQNRIRRLPAVPWRELPSALAGFDINLAPLALDNPFSQSKSEIKYVEAALVGVPTIASPTGAFMVGIRSGENGYLAETPEEWKGVLEALLDEKHREEMGDRAYRDSQLRYGPRARARESAARLNEICAALGAGLHIEIPEEVPPASPHLLWTVDDERQPTLLRMALYTVRRRGLLTLLRQVWIYFRRLLARFIPYG